MVTFAIVMIMFCPIFCNMVTFANVWRPMQHFTSPTSIQNHFLHFVGWSCLSCELWCDSRSEFVLHELIKLQLRFVAPLPCPLRPPVPAIPEVKIFWKNIFFWKMVFVFRKQNLVFEKHFVLENIFFSEKIVSKKKCFVFQNSKHPPYPPPIQDARAKSKSRELIIEDVTNQYP